MTADALGPDRTSQSAGSVFSHFRWLAAGTLLCLARSVHAWGFVDVTAAAGLVYEHGYADPSSVHEAELTAGGVAAGDYDRDGWIDLYVVRGTIGPNLLFHNTGHGTFEEVGAAAGVAQSGAFGAGPTFADVDGDGWLDLIVLGVHGTAPILFRNRGDGTFEDVTHAAGLAVDRDSFSAAFGDYDHDGDLDLFITHWGTYGSTTSTQHLWRNNGDGTFTDASVASGIAAAFLEPISGTFHDLSFTPNFADINDDGWPDLLIAGDFHTSMVFLNNRDGTFTNATAAMLSDEDGMGGAVGDYDNDGDLDWFVSSVWDPNGTVEQGGFWFVSGNRLYRNDGAGRFSDATDIAGVRAGYWGWASTFADLNNDGVLDLFHVNGWGPLDSAPSAEFHFDSARCFIGNGDGTFTERAAQLGADDTGQGRGVVAFDYDRDGDLDLFIANNQQPPRLLRNDGGNASSYLDVKLQGLAPNSEAVGARVYVTVGAQTQMRELRAGSNFESQDPAEAHFGLGTTTTVDELRVRWPAPATETTTLRNVAANRLLTITQPAPPPTSTPLSTPTPTASPQPTALPCVGDCNADSTVTVDELVSLVNVALEAVPESRCGATDGRSVTIDIIIEAVNNALRGCPSGKRRM